MKVAIFKGLLIAVLTRDHCDPHVHVRGRGWKARYEFSFWHNDIRLWDVVPSANSPGWKQLEELRVFIKEPSNLRTARELWWGSHKMICLENKYWDTLQNEVVQQPTNRVGTFQIVTAVFDPKNYSTIIKVVGQTELLEIKL